MWLENLEKLGTLKRKADEDLDSTNSSLHEAKMARIQAHVHVDSQLDGLLHTNATE